MHLATGLRVLVVAFAIVLVGTLCAQEPLSLSIVPETFHEKSGASIRTTRSFYVIITNQSDRPVRVWREWCSWGYFSLSLEAETPEREVLSIQKKPREWYRNFPDYFIIMPDGHFVMPVTLRDEWQGYPAKEQKVRLRAHYEIKADEYSERESVWTGRLVSPWIDVTVYE